MLLEWNKAKIDDIFFGKFSLSIYFIRKMPFVIFSLGIITWRQFNDFMPFLILNFQPDVGPLSTVPTMTTYALTQLLVSFIKLPNYLIARFVRLPSLSFRIFFSFNLCASSMSLITPSLCVSFLHFYFISLLIFTFLSA